MNPETSLLMRYINYYGMCPLNILACAFSISHGYWGWATFNGLIALWLMSDNPRYDK